MKYCLIIEDNDISRDVFESHITELGLENKSACSGAEALVMCAERMPDVILLEPVQNLFIVI